MLSFFPYIVFVVYDLHRFLCFYFNLLGFRMEKKFNFHMILFLFKNTRVFATNISIIIMITKSDFCIKGLTVSIIIYNCNMSSKLISVWSQIWHRLVLFEILSEESVPRQGSGYIGISSSLHYCPWVIIDCCSIWIIHKIPIIFACRWSQIIRLFFSDLL